MLLLAQLGQVIQYRLANLMDLLGLETQLDQKVLLIPVSQDHQVVRLDLLDQENQQGP